MANRVIYNDELKRFQDLLERIIKMDLPTLEENKLKRVDFVVKRLMVEINIVVKKVNDEISYQKISYQRSNENIKRLWIAFINKAPNKPIGRDAVMAYISQTHPSLTVGQIQAIVKLYFDDDPLQKIKSEEEKLLVLSRIFEEYNNVSRHIQLISENNRLKEDKSVMEAFASFISQIESQLASAAKEKEVEAVQDKISVFRRNYEKAWIESFNKLKANIEKEKGGKIKMNKEADMDRATIEFILLQHPDVVDKPDANEKIDQDTRKYVAGIILDPKYRISSQIFQKEIGDLQIRVMVKQLELINKINLDALEENELKIVDFDVKRLMNQINTAMQKVKNEISSQRSKENLKKEWIAFINKAPNKPIGRDAVMAYISQTHPSLTVGQIQANVKLYFDDNPLQKIKSEEEKLSVLSQKMADLEKKAEVIKKKLQDSSKSLPLFNKHKAEKDEIPFVPPQVVKGLDEDERAVITEEGMKAIDEYSKEREETGKKDVEKILEEINNILNDAQVRHGRDEINSCLTLLKNSDKFDAQEKAQLLFIVLEEVIEVAREKNTILKNAMAKQIKALKEKFPYILPTHQVDLNRILTNAPEITKPLSDLREKRSTEFLDVDTRGLYKKMEITSWKKNIFGHIAQRWHTSDIREGQLSRITAVKDYLKTQKALSPKEKAQILFIALKTIDDELVHEKRSTKAESRLERAIAQEMYNLNKTFNTHFDLEITEHQKAQPATKAVEEILDAQDFDAKGDISIQKRKEVRDLQIRVMVKQLELINKIKLDALKENELKKIGSDVDKLMNQINKAKQKLSNEISFLKQQIYLQKTWKVHHAYYLYYDINLLQKNLKSEEEKLSMLSQKMADLEKKAKVIENKLQDSSKSPPKAKPR